MLRLVASGQTNREIASALVISEHTARHIQNIFESCACRRELQRARSPTSTASSDELAVVRINHAGHSKTWWVQAMPWARGRRTVLLVDTTTRTRYADEPGRVSDAGGQARRKLLAMLPLSERRIEAAGVSTVVLEGGAGPPLVLQHGGIECGGVVWGPVISRLAERHRLVVPDLPGLGESEPVDRLDTKTFLEWFAALLEATCDEEPVLVAHSLLGSLAPIAAQALGLRKLIVYAAPGIGPYRMPLGLMAAAIRFNLRPTQRNQERFERWAFRDADRTRRQDEHWFEAFDAYTVACGRVPHVKRTMRQLVKTGTKRVPDAELRRVECRWHSSGEGTIGWFRCMSPREQPRVSGGHCTWSTTPVTYPTSSSPMRFWRHSTAHCTDPNQSAERRNHGNTARIRRS